MMRSRLLTFLTPLLIAATVLGQSSVTLSPSKDNTLYQSANGSLSNGAGDGLFVGRNNGSMSPVTIRRAVLAFDVASVIPAGATIQSVQLRLVLVGSSGGTHPVSLHRVLADWGEGASVATSGGGGGGPSAPGDATWIHRFYPGTPWNTPGGDFSSTVSATENVGGFPGFSFYWGSTAQMVADVQSWVDGTAPNYGWMMRAPEQGGTNARKLASRESFYPPELTITYLPPAASLTVVGQGCTSSAQTLVTLGGSGLPSLGNASFALDLAGAPAGAAASLFFADQATAVPFALTPSCAVHVELASAVAYVQAGVSPLFTAPAGSLGSVSYPLPLPLDPSLAGFSLAFQVIVVDPPSVGGLVTSNAVEIVLGS